MQKRNQQIIEQNSYYQQKSTKRQCKQQEKAIQQKSLHNISQLPQESKIRYRLLKINGDIQDRFAVWFFRIIVLVVLITIFLVKLALPSSYQTISNQISFSNYPDELGCNPIAVKLVAPIICNQLSEQNPRKGLYMANISTKNQFAIYYLDLHMNTSILQNFSFDQQIKIEAYQIIKFPSQTNQSSISQLFIRRNIYSHTTAYKFTGKQMTVDDQNNNRYLRMLAYDRITLKQDQLLTNSLVMLTFTNNNQLANINQIKLYAVVVNPAFTIFTIVVRGVYCLLAVASAIFYIRRYFQIQAKNRIMEMHLVALSSIYLIFFNDPFYAITLLKNNGVSTFFSSIFVVGLIMHLTMLWIFFLRKIYYEPEQNSSEMLKPARSWPFYLVMFGLIASISALFLQYSYYIYQKIPIILSSSLVEMKAIPTIVFVAIFLTVASVYQIVMFIRIIKKYCCSKENDFKQLLWRHKNYLTYYPFFFIIFLLFFGFGGAMPYNYEGAWILYGYSFLNIFIFILQFLYYVPSTELNQPQITNPQNVQLAQNNITLNKLDVNKQNMVQVSLPQ